MRLHKTAIERLLKFPGDPGVKIFAKSPVDSSSKLSRTSKIFINSEAGYF